MDEIFLKIEKLPLFSGLDKKEMSKHLSNMQYYKKIYKKGMPLILQGMPYKALFIIVTGNCSGEMTDDSTRVVKIDDFQGPCTLASALLFADDNSMPVTVWAKTDVLVLILKKDDIVKLCGIYQQFLLNLLSDISNRFTFISHKLAYLKLKSLQERILLYLSRQPADNDGFIDIKPSFHEVAALLGVERPSLSRALIRMEKNRLIVRKRKKIKVLPYS